ncbi:MAG: thiamine biosynthesis protein ThiS [Cytophagaceae bacterium]|jgi:sulfur carrier protein|nr:thiamine biosynthesis protein ThiS [Cytophagaceae bacterium]
MTVFVNDQVQDLKTQFTLIALLSQLSLDEQKGIAVAVNNHVVPKKNWNSHLLSEQDKVTIIRASQGG